MEVLFTLDATMPRDPRIEAWFSRVTDPHRLTAKTWFARMRACGPDVRELFHDGCPVACVDDAPFAYVNAFKAYASIGFYQGASLSDPRRLLEGDGKRMRHVKLRPGGSWDGGALNDLIDAAYRDIRRRLGHGKKKGSADMKKKSSKGAPKDMASASAKIDAHLKALGDWRGKTLARVRALIREADPDAIESWKWGIPVWEDNGIITTGETYKDKVKLTFARGAALKDPSRLFNSSLEGNVRRAIDIREGQKIDEKALKALIRAAADLNRRATSAKSPRAR